MDFWCWRYLRPAGLGGSRPAWPSTIFPTLFDMEFPGHFGTDLASILKLIWNICISVWHLKLHHRFLTFSLRFSMQKWYPSTMENSIITWYSRKKQRNLTFRFYMHFIKICALILAWISCYFEQILHIFRASIFVCISGYVFLTFGTKMAAKRLPKSTRNLKKNQKSALQFNWYVPDSVLTPFWMHFDRHLEGFRNLLVAICCRC